MGPNPVIPIPYYIIRYGLGKMASLHLLPQVEDADDLAVIQSGPMKTLTYI